MYFHHYVPWTKIQDDMNKFKDFYVLSVLSILILVTYCFCSKSEGHVYKNVQYVLVYDAIHVVYI